MSPGDCGAGQNARPDPNPYVISSIGWPTAVLVFAVFFVVFFQKEIRLFLGRVKSVGRDGLSTDEIPKAQTEDNKGKAVEDLLRLGDSAFFKDVEDLITAELEKRQLGPSEEAVKVLTHHLAATQIALEFEQVHAVIFGSQIFLLKKLNEYSGVGLNEQFVEKHFNHVKSMFSDGLDGWTLEQYLSFLFNRFLITKDFGVYQITMRGSEYLTWVVRTGHREDRPL